MDRPMVARYPSCPACRRLSEEVGEARWKLLQDWLPGTVPPNLPEPPLYLALRGFREIIPADRASLVTPMPGGRLRVVASSDLQWTGDILISLERYPELSFVLRTGEPFIAGDVRSSKLLAAVLPTLEGLGILSLMAIPMDRGPVPMVFRLLSAERRYGTTEARIAQAAAHLLEHAIAAPPPPASLAEAWKGLAGRQSDCTMEILPNGQIASIDGRTDELFGLPARELEGRQAEDLFWTGHAASSGRHVFQLLETLRGPSGRSRIATIPTANGRMAAVCLSEVPGVLLPRICMAVRLSDGSKLSLDDIPAPALRFRENTVVAANQRAKRLLDESPDATRVKLFSRETRALTFQDPAGHSKDFLVLRQEMGEAGETLVILVDAQPQMETARRVETLQAALAQHMSALEEARHRMEQLEILKSHFMASSAHELKTPLTVLQSYLEILSTDLADGLSEEQRSFLDIAYRNVLRLRRLVLDLTDLAALDGGKILVEIKRVRLEPIISRVIQDMRPLAREAGLDLRMEIPGELPDVRADASRVEQVLHNLVDNALKYTPTGGSVTVTTGTSGDGVVVEVHDTGIGIPAGEESSIFEPFYRATDHHSDLRVEGSGLGLTICRRIMGALGGRLSVTSVPGKGSTFRVRLPSWPEDSTVHD